MRNGSLKRLLSPQETLTFCLARLLSPQGALITAGLRLTQYSDNELETHADTIRGIEPV